MAIAKAVLSIFGFLLFASARAIATLELASSHWVYVHRGRRQFGGRRRVDVRNAQIDERHHGRRRGHHLRWSQSPTTTWRGSMSGRPNGLRACGVSEHRRRAHDQFVLRDAVGS